MIDANRRRVPRTFVWGLICRLSEIINRLRFATAEFALDLAHTRGGTALHAAARHGHTVQAKWLLEHGARPSLHVKNAMGCTPLEVAHLFGPFPETEAALARAILEERVGSSTVSDEDAGRYGCDRRTAAALLLYPMYLLPVRTLLDLSVLPSHEELPTQGKLV